LIDAIEDGKTGILVPAYDPEAFAAAMIRFSRDELLRVAMGKNARARVERDFRQEYLTRALVKFYDRLQGQA
jgi:glycosyltransferase involved in cell wall biosynthesis